MALIQRVEVYAVDYPFVGYFKFFVGPPGRTWGRPAVLVKITDDMGVTGWGQCGPSPRWSGETLETAVITLERYLATAIIGMDADDATAINAAMHREIAGGFSIGQPIAKSAIEMALWDLQGKKRGEPLHAMLGKATPGSVTLSWTINARSLAEMEESVTLARQRGYHDFNVKVGPDPDFDAALCRRLRQLAPSAMIWADANGGYDLPSALRAAPALADLGIAFLEQPFPGNQLSDFGALRRQGALPILMDEPLLSVVELREFHRLGLLDGAAIKVSRVGGLAEAVLQIEYLREHGLIFAGSGLTDPDLALAASLALFDAHGLRYPAALNGPQYLADSLLRHPIVINNAEASTPSGPGLGVAIDENHMKSRLIAIM